MSISFNKEKYLANNCQSEKIAKCAVAAWAHAATTRTQMFYANEKHYMLKAGHEYLSNYIGQEILFIEFDNNNKNNNSSYVAIIYEKEDLVMLCTKVSLMKEKYFGPRNPMTTYNFFCYLNALPNIIKHMDPSGLNNETKLGLDLLGEFST